MESLFKDVNRWRSFLDFIEKKTVLYQLDFLGYPWYRSAIEIANNNQYSLMPLIKSHAIAEQRKSDFQQKIPLLAENYSHVFLLRAHQRRRDVRQFENYLFHDLFIYLQKKNEPFLILEMPSNSDEYDVKYLNSQFADVTIPYEYLPDISHYYLNKKITAQAQKQFQSLANELFANVFLDDPFYTDCVALLKKAYARLADNIRHILILQALLNNFGVKAFWGSMMTELLSGLNNAWSVIEIEHGTGVRAATRIYNESAARYYDSHFHWKKFFALTMCQDKTHSQALKDNTFNYGMPEVRHSNLSAAKKSKFIDRLQANGKRIFLIATSGTNSNQEISTLVRHLNKNIPEILFLVRQHPFFDHPLLLADVENVEYVNRENLFVLLSAADIIISPPSSIVEQASMFTDNIVIYRKFAPTFDDEPIARRYPWAKLLDLRDVDRFCRVIKDLLSTPSKAMIRHSSDVSQDLNSLFERIDAAYTARHHYHGEQFLQVRCRAKLWRVDHNLDAIKRILRAVRRCASRQV